MASAVFLILVFARMLIPAFNAVVCKLLFKLIWPPSTVMAPTDTMDAPNVTSPLLVLLPIRTLEGLPVTRNAVASTEPELATDSKTTAPEVLRVVVPAVNMLLPRSVTSLLIDVIVVVPLMLMDSLPVPPPGDPTIVIAPELALPIAAVSILTPSLLSEPEAPALPVMLMAPPAE